jgi:hypothetical protein
MGWGRGSKKLSSLSTQNKQAAEKYMFFWKRKSSPLEPKANFSRIYKELSRGASG